MVMFKVYEEIDEADLHEPERKILFDLTGLTLKDYREYLAEKEGTRKAPSHEEKEQAVESLDGAKIARGRSAQVSHNDSSPVRNSSKTIRSGAGDDTLGRETRKERVEREFAVREHSDESTKKSGVNRSAINKAADIREIEAMIRQSKSTSREDLQELMINLQAQDFDKETLEPYLEHVKAQMKRIDEVYLDSLMGDVLNLSSDEGVEVYEQIKEANILPELKANALKQLEKRLSRIKADESELLMKKLQKDMAEAGLEEPERHHYYPAKRVIMKEVTEDEVAEVEYAKASYGAGIGPFEYPIWAVDTSLNRSGDKGMFLTPEKIYYSKMY